LDRRALPGELGGLDGAEADEEADALPPGLRICLVGLNRGLAIRLCGTRACLLMRDCPQRERHTAMKIMAVKELYVEAILRAPSD